MGTFSSSLNVVNSLQSIRVKMLNAEDSRFKLEAKRSLPVICSFIQCPERIDDLAREYILFVYKQLAEDGYNCLSNSFIKMLRWDVSANYIEHDEYTSFENSGYALNMEPKPKKLAL